MTFLLIIPYGAVVLGLAGLLFNFSMCGKKGIQYLDQRAQAMGKKKQHINIMGALIFFDVIAVSICLLLFGLWIVAHNGKQGVGMDWLRRYGLIAAGGMVVLSVILATVQRRWVRRQMEDGSALNQRIDSSGRNADG